MTNYLDLSDSIIGLMDVGLLISTSEFHLIVQILAFLLVDKLIG